MEVQQNKEVLHGDEMKKEITNGKCENFVNDNCGYNCPNAALEAACDRWDLDPSDFGMEYIDCEECMYWDDNCTCDDCFVQFNPEYCPKPKKLERGE